MLKWFSEWRARRRLSRIPKGVSRVEVGRDDVLVVRSPDHLSVHARQQIEKHIRSVVGAGKVMLIEGDLELCAVLSPRSQSESK